MATVCKKYGWPSRELADGHRLLIEHNPKYERPEGMVLHVYRCPFCTLFHVGHSRPWVNRREPLVSMTPDDSARRRC